MRQISRHIERTICLVRNVLQSCQYITENLSHMLTVAAAVVILETEFSVEVSFVGN